MKEEKGKSAIIEAATDSEGDGSDSYCSDTDSHVKFDTDYEIEIPVYYNSN